MTKSPKSPHPVAVHVGKRIRHRRWMLGMTQQQLGQALGRPSPSILKIESAKMRLSVGELAEIASALDEKIEFFFAGYEG